MSSWRFQRSPLHKRIIHLAKRKFRLVRRNCMDDYFCILKTSKNRQLDTTSKFCSHHHRAFPALRTSRERRRAQVLCTKFCVPTAPAHTLVRQNTYRNELGYTVNPCGSKTENEVLSPSIARHSTWTWLQGDNNPRVSPKGETFLNHGTKLKPFPESSSHGGYARSSLHGVSLSVVVPGSV